MIDFKEIEAGASVGGYALERRIRDDAAGVFFAAVSDGGERLLLKLTPGSSPEAERQFARWLRARLLLHPNLLDVREVGRAELAGEPFIYSVFEYPDEVLAAALEQGPLSEMEARGVLEAALSGLRYLHGQGVAHGKVDADHIVAVGDSVKLTTDALREPEDLAAYAEDVRQLGELVRRLRGPEPLGEPLATIARHAAAASAHDRWTLAEITVALATAPPIPVAVKPAPVEAIPAPPPPPPVTVPPPVSVPPAVTVPPSAASPAAAARAQAQAPAATAPTPETPPAAAAPAAVLVLPPPRHRGHEPTQELRRRPFPKWIIAGVAILLFSIVVWNLRRKPGATPTPPQRQTAAVTPPAAVPPAAKPAPAQPRRAESRPESRAESRPPAAVWRVIAFTYRSREAALKKARQLNTRWPELHAELFTPKRRHGYYLVALGNWMSREEATRLEQRARRMGLPRDTYVQNYNE